MTLNILFAAADADWDRYRDALNDAFAGAGLAADLSRDHPPATVDYIVFAPTGSLRDFTPYTRCRAVLSLWAGVETIIGNATLTQPLARMVDPDLTAGMVEWVTGHTLRHHLGMDSHILGQDGLWRDAVPPLARERRVTILGLGALGHACGAALAGLGFPVTGWSRTARDIPGIACLHGDAGLTAALSGAGIVILLLPATPATANILNAATLALPARGATIINPGRGTLIDDDALLAALDSGQIGHATLDVFRTEPLPRDHPYWAHSRVTVTPHTAAHTRPASAGVMIATNIARVEAGQPLLNRVDRLSGY
jgi:glyoxylate/hydroxypyruvate reductase A